MKKCVIKGVISVVLTVILVGFIPTCVCAAETPIDPKFDYKYYADTYADLKAAFGYDQNALWKHYVEHGQYEKRSCYKGDPNGTATNADASTAASQQVVNVDEYNRLMLEKINAYRASKGLGQLENRSELYAVAEARVPEVASKFSHTRTNKTSFKTVYEELGHEGVFQKAGENLAYIKNDWDFNVDGDVDAYVDRFFQIYLKSASHRKNILKSDWKYYGGAFITNYNGKCYNIQIFAN